ncbi:hypothetical protein GA0070616_4453 [Micromonospora nigra]|uniref:Uncharacterized protein n=1 Tax=Micromonospora nigra TaxID=145857 RepID=A0A1C6SSC2_9ACTN|nr:hypothetical protein [Micromonospora nigra]SCL32391.1 hypothetical protein GA0070616_4453 [Micromonospora nigra]
MEKRHLGTLAFVAVLALMAIVGAVGGFHLAGPGDPRSTDSPTRADGGPAGSDADPDAADPDAADPDAADPDTTGSDATGSEPQEPDRPRTYPLDRPVYDQASMRVTLVNAEVRGGSLRLNVTYRNDSAVPWPLSCPTAEDDRTSSRITLADGRSVGPDNSWCATHRPGESFLLAPGAQATSWGDFPVVPEAGSAFRLSWYGFPEVADLRLR